MNKILLGAALPALLAFGTIHSATAQTVSHIVFEAEVTTPVTVTKGHSSHTSYTTYNQIFSMNPDGSDVVQLTSANASALGPCWSPGQNYIAFSRNQTLYVMEAKGEANGGRTFVVAPADATGGCDWSPDGTQLVYEGPSGNLYIVPVDVVNGKAGGPPVLFRLGSYSGPSWSPDGSKIAFWGSDDGNLPFFIHVRDVVGGGEYFFGLPSGDNGDPQWSPNGTLIAFDGAVTWTVTTKKGTSTSWGYEIFIANADGSGITRQTYLDDAAWFPTWSPDGTTIVFFGEVPSGTTFTEGLYTTTVLGSHVATLLYSDGYAPDWNP